MHRITIPHFLVDAIALVPYGATPTALNQRYEVHANHITVYQDAAETEESFDKFLEEFILSCSNQRDFVKKIGLPPSWTRIQSSNK